MADDHTHSGMAALSICEALPLALNDAKVLPEDEIMGVLGDAASAHKNAGVGDVDVEMHKGAAALIRKIIAGGNSVRRR